VVSRQDNVSVKLVGNPVQKYLLKPPQTPNLRVEPHRIKDREAKLSLKVENHEREASRLSLHPCETFRSL